MAQKVHEKPDTKGPYKGHLGHKGDIKATMGTFFNRVINVPNVPGSDSKIDRETRHDGAARGIADMICYA